MKTAAISETKNNRSALLDRVRAGETVLILDRGTPVARLEPVRPGRDAGQEAISRLERSGALTQDESEGARRRLREPETGWTEVEPSDAVKSTARLSTAARREGFTVVEP